MYETLIVAFKIVYQRSFISIIILFIFTAQEQNGNQIIGPTKIYLAVQPSQPPALAQVSI